MLALLGFLWAAGPPQGPPSVDAAQFVNLVEAQTASLKDIAFLYEGELRWIGPKEVLGREIDTLGEQFQGAYLYRRNDAALLDIYAKRHLATAGVVRRRTALLRGIMEIDSRSSDAKRRAPPKPLQEKRSGSFAALGGSASPNVLFQPWRLLGVAAGPPGTFHAVGYETVRGRRCLRIRLGGERDSDAGSHDDYWVDMDRNANILKNETYRDGKVAIRIDEVDVLKVPTRDRTEFWVPIRARLQGFDWNGTIHAAPLMEEIIEVVDGSVLVNQGLPDGLFTIHRESGLPGPGELEALRKAGDLRLGQEYASTPEAPSQRIDPAGVRERLDSNLAEADRQVEMLEASAPSREGWSWVGASQILLVSACVALVVGALVMRRRAG